MDRYAPADLTAFAAALLEAAGVPQDEALAVAQSLVDSNLCGHDSHGVIRLPWYVKQLAEGELAAGVDLKILRETPAVIVADAQLGFGQIQAARLFDRLVSKARQVGVSSGTALNSGHVGRLGEFTEQVARQGLAAFLTVNDNGYRIVAPPGGTEARISTNPLSMAVPTSTEPIVFDASTSAVAQGKVLVRRLDGRPCPEGWVQDAHGQPSTDPRVLTADPPGTLLPLGGAQAHKGFGLGVLLDMLAGGLSGGFCPPPRDGYKLCNNILAIVWDPELLAGRDHLVEQTSALADSIRTCPVRNDADAIRLPGDTGRRARAERDANGIPLPSGTWTALEKVAKRLKVACPEPIS